MHTAKEKAARGHHPVLKKVFAVLGVLLAAIVVYAVVYVNDFYRADAEALEALNGSREVTVSVSDRELIFEPSGIGTPNLHTGLIFYPGGKVEYTAYAPLMTELAGRGITCMVLKMPFNLAFLDSNAAEGVAESYNSGVSAAQTALSGRQPVTRWYIGGHSLGGVAACMYLANGHADEYEGLLLLGSYTASDLSGCSLKALQIIGENDGLVTPARYEAADRLMPANAQRVILPGGCHAYFGSYGEQDGDGTASITPQQQRTLTADLAAQWMAE